MGVTKKGVVQGDPYSGDFFCVGLQPSLVQLDSECWAGGGMTRAWLITAMPLVLQMLWQVLEAATGLSIPRGKEGNMVIQCPIEGININ